MTEVTESKEFQSSDDLQIIYQSGSYVDVEPEHWPLLKRELNPKSFVREEDTVITLSGQDQETLLPIPIPIPIPIKDIESSNYPLEYGWDNINVYTVHACKIACQQTVCCRKYCPSGRKKLILKNVTGYIRSGQLLAVMGSSGAGKSTLLNVLTFRNTKHLHVSGDLYINGTPVGPDDITTISGYVQQDDLFLGMLTVKEHLVFQARVRMAKDISYEVRMNRVEEVIQDLGLKNCWDSRIGIPGIRKGISGGEMKRLAFACEILTDPPILFCDEPTTGLDAFMARSVVQMMKDMVQRGKCVICTIHQPSSDTYDLFDRLLLMADGRVAFLGQKEDALNFFSTQGLHCPLKYNPADFFVHQLAIRPNCEEECLKKVHDICNKFEESESFIYIKSIASNGGTGNTLTQHVGNKDNTWKHKSIYKSSWLTQLVVLLRRSWITLVRDPMTFKLRIAETIFVALLLGTIYYKQEDSEVGVINIKGALFLIVVTISFQNVFSVVNSFCHELPIFLREHFNGMYRADTYFISKTMAESPLYILYPLIFISISYFMIGLNNFNPMRFFNCAIISVLVSNVAVSFGYMISCMSNSTQAALACITPFLMPFLLFGGYFLNVEDAPTYAKWFKYLSWFYYANEAMNINQWQDNTTITCKNINSHHCQNTTGLLILKQDAFDPNMFDRDLVALFISVAAFRLLAFAAFICRTLGSKH